MKPKFKIISLFLVLCLAAGLMPVVTLAAAADTGKAIQLADGGTAAMNLLRGPRTMTPYDCQFLRDRLRGKPYLPLAYFEGASPENGYHPHVPYTLNVLTDPRPQDVEPGYLRLYLKTAGADSPRPMRLRRKGSTGQWFLWEYSSILSGVRIPAAEDPWA